MEDSSSFWKQLEDQIGRCWKLSEEPRNYAGFGAVFEDVFGDLQPCFSGVLLKSFLLQIFVFL
jgi:DNA-binding transcriptional regulator PaaX